MLHLVLLNGDAVFRSFIWIYQLIMYCSTLSAILQLIKEWSVNCFQNATDFDCFSKSFIISEAVFFFVLCSILGGFIKVSHTFNLAPFLNQFYQLYKFRANTSKVRKLKLWRKKREEHIFLHNGTFQLEEKHQQILSFCI